MSSTVRFTLLAISLTLVGVMGASASAEAPGCSAVTTNGQITPFTFGWQTDFTTLYGSAPHSCSTCHTAVPTRNPYGMALENAAGATRTERMQAVEGADSDGDGTSNIDEINAGLNPGDPADGGPAGPTFVGSSACMGCHTSTHSSWLTTLHSSIYRQPVGDNFLSVWSGVISVEDASRGLGPIYLDLSDSGDPANGPFTATIYQDAGLTQMIAGPMEVARVHGGRAILENANTSERNVPGSVRGLRSNNPNPVEINIPSGTSPNDEATLTADYYPGEGPWIGKQRYQVTIGDQHYILPIQYNPIADFDRNSGGWVEYHLRDWIDGSFNLVLEAADSEERRCAGCHQTGIEHVIFDDVASATVPGTAHLIDGAFVLEGDAIEENIRCEACHGPASGHVNGGFMGLPGSREIVQPALNLDVQQRVDACGFCHSRGTSVDTVGGVALGYPYRNPENHRPIPGDAWGDFYVEGGNFWIDEDGLTVSSSHHQQYEEFLQTNHFNFQFHRLSCSDCHDNHGTLNEHDIVTSVDNSVSGEVAVTGARGVGEGNLCVGCHYSHGPFDNTLENVDFERHFWHPPDGTHGSPDCTNCHMAATATSGVPYDIHTHSFTVLEPTRTLEGIAMMDPMINSCMVMCHNGPFSTSFSSPGPVNPDRDVWDDPEDEQIALFLEMVMPGHDLVVNYLLGDPEIVHLINDSPYMAPALDPNADTELTTGMDASPFVINAADVVTFINHDR